MVRLQIISGKSSIVDLIQPFQIQSNFLDLVFEFFLENPDWLAYTRSKSALIIVSIPSMVLSVFPLVADWGYLLFEVLLARVILLLKKSCNLLLRAKICKN